MGVQERKERDKTEMQEKILEAAAEILKAEGIGAISIRKIAEKIEYSPAIVYHYFKDKEDIVNHIIADHYQQLLTMLSQPDLPQGNPEVIFVQGIRRYIDYATGMGDMYQAIMLSDSPEIVARTSVLHRGAALDRPAIEMLCRVLGQINAGRDIDEKQIEAQAQIIWASAFGLILRLMIEKVDQEQKERLIDAYMDITLRAIRQE